MLKAITTLILLFGLTSEMLAEPISISSVLESQKQQFLHPDEAFLVQTGFVKKNQLEISFQIAEGYYLYKSKIFLTTENMSSKKNYTSEFMRIDAIVRSITLNFMDYYGYDTNQWTFRSRRTLLAGTNLSRVDRLLGKHWANKERKRKLETTNRSNSRIGD